MANRYCLNCGSFVPEGVKFCPTCGEPYKEKSSTMPNIVFPEDPQDKVTTPSIAFPKEPEEDRTLHTTTDIPFPRKTLSEMKMDEAATQSIPTIEISQQDIPQPIPAPAVEEQPQPTYVPKRVAQKPKKKRNIFSRIIFDEDEEDEEIEDPITSYEDAYNNYEDEDEAEPHNIVAIVIVVVLAILIGVLGFLYFERPDILDSALKNIGLGLPGYKQPQATVEPTTEPTNVPSATVEATSTPVPTESASPYVGSLKVIIEHINIRDTYSTSGNALGQVSVGETYDVLSVKENEDYTWYEIKEGQWIADSQGSWVEYKAN